MYAFLKRHVVKITIVLFAGILLLLWGGFSLHQKDAAKIEFLIQENKALNEHMIAGETNGLLKNFRVMTYEFHPKDNTISVMIEMVPREITPTMTASIVWNGTETPLPRNEHLKNTFLTELKTPVQESNLVSSITLKDGQRTDSAETAWIFHPWELFRTRADAYVTASPTKFSTSKDRRSFSGDIECHISDYFGEPTATLSKIVNGEIVENTQLRLRKKGLEYIAYSEYKVEVSEDLKTEYVLQLVTEEGLGFRHTALEIDGIGIENFAFNTETEVYNPESGAFLFAVP